MIKNKLQPMTTFLVVSVLVSLGVVVGMAITPARAQSPFTKIGFVDYKQALGEHPKRQGIYDQMQTYQKAKMAELPALDVSSSPTKAQIDDYLKKQSQITADIQKENDRLIAPLIEDIDKTIKEIGQEWGAEIILQGESVLYGGLDLTPEVIKRLQGSSAP
jgi:outer membrane protein